MNIVGTNATRNLSGFMGSILWCRFNAPGQLLTNSHCVDCEHMQYKISIITFSSYYMQQDQIKLHYGLWIFLNS